MHLRLSEEIFSRYPWCLFFSGLACTTVWCCGNAPQYYCLVCTLCLSILLLPPGKRWYSVCIIWFVQRDPVGDDYGRVREDKGGEKKVFTCNKSQKGRLKLTKICGLCSNLQPRKESHAVFVYAMFCLSYCY